MVTKKVGAEAGTETAAHEQEEPLDAIDTSAPTLTSEPEKATLTTEPEKQPEAGQSSETGEGSEAEPQVGTEAQTDSGGDLLSKRAAGTVEAQGMIPPYEGRTLVAHEQIGVPTTTGGLGQAAGGGGGGDLDLEHHTKGLGRRPHPGLVPAKGRTAYGGGVTTLAGEQSVTTGGLGQAVHGVKSLDLEHHTKGLGRRPHPGLVPAKGRIAYGGDRRTRRGGEGRTSWRQRLGLDRLSSRT